MKNDLLSKNIRIKKIVSAASTLSQGIWHIHNIAKHPVPHIRSLRLSAARAAPLTTGHR